MEEFRVPEDFNNLSALQTPVEDRFCVSSDLPDLRQLCDDRGAAELNDRLDAVASRLGVENGDGDGEDPAALAAQEIFDDVFAFVSVFKYLPSKIKQRVLIVLDQFIKRIVPALGGEGGAVGGGRKSVRNARKAAVSGVDEESAAQSQGQAPLELRNAFQMAVYLLFSAAYPAEEVYFSSKQNEVLGDKPTRGVGSRGGKKSSSGSKDFKWEEARVTVLKAFRLALTVDPSRIWRQGVPDRTFMGLFLRLSCKMLELPETVNIPGQPALDLISGPFLMAQGMESEVSAATFQLVCGHKHKHLSAPIAGLCHQLVQTHGNSRLAAELVRDIGRMEMLETARKNSAESSPVVRVSDFLREMVMLLPGLVHAHASILLPHLSSRPYQIRNAVVFAIAEVIAAAHEDDIPEEAGEASPEEEGQEGLGGSQTDPRRVRLKAKNRDALFDQLKERALDVSHFVRMTVLKAWAVITQRGALPRKRFLIAARVGADRLRDQSSLVRKEAVKLVATLVAYNPYSITLDRASNQQRLDRAEAELRAMSPSIPAVVPTPAQNKNSEAQAIDGDDLENGRDDGSVTEKDDGLGPVDKQAHELIEDVAKSGEDVLPEDSEEDVSKRDAKLAECEHFVATMLFIKELETATERMGGMLGSKTTTDVVESLRFFVKACHFQLPGAVEAVKQSLTLIWRTEGNIEAEIKKAFLEVFVQPASEEDSDSGEGLPAQQVARNLVRLVNESKPGELASLEEVVASLTKDLDPEIFEQLWCAVNSRGQMPKGRAGALHAIAMGASADSSLVTGADRLSMVREIALGKATMEARDWRTVQCACIALLRCDLKVVRNNLEAGLILTRLMYFLQGKWCISVTANTSPEERAEADEEMKEWFAAAEQAVAVLFHFSDKPESHGAAVVRRMAGDTLSSDAASPLALARLCFVLGHVALKLLVYSEEVAGTLERARAKTKAPPKKTGCENNSQEDDDDATAQELGLNAEASAEDEARLAELVEKEIVGRNLLGVFGPLLARIVADEEGCFGHRLLRQSAVLALSKFMCISGGFCERHLELLFTTLERETDTAVRSNIVVALGDLAFRFPNALEPWNKRMYGRLRDRCPRVRANAIMVLTHLILNDMVKVKGQVSELAVCMVDPEPRIQDAAKIFFHKYSEVRMYKVLKGIVTVISELELLPQTAVMRGANPVYNVLPDIVGRLSGDASLKPAEFIEIMNFLMGYPMNEKLVEQLAEKLVARLTASANDGILQSRNVAYCIGQLKATEKVVVRLAELVPHYKDLLRDSEVYDQFLALIARAKKFAGPEMQLAVAEWAGTLQEFHEGGAEDEDAAARATQARHGRRSSKRSSTISARGNPTAEEVQIHDAGPQKFSIKTANAPKSSRRSKAKKKAVVESSSEEEDGGERGSSTDGDGLEDDQTDDGDNGHDQDRLHKKKADGRQSRRPTPRISSGNIRRRLASKESGRNAAVPSETNTSAGGGNNDDEEEQWQSEDEDDVFEPTRKNTKKKKHEGTKENLDGSKGKGKGLGTAFGKGGSRGRRVVSPLSPLAN